MLIGGMHQTVTPQARGYRAYLARFSLVGRKPTFLGCYTCRRLGCVDPNLHVFNDATRHVFLER